jgi:hypothetical protein
MVQIKDKIKDSNFIKFNQFNNGGILERSVLLPQKL